MMSTGEPPDPQEPKEAPAIKTGTVAESAAANPKLIAWLKLNWKAMGEGLKLTSQAA